MGYREFTCIVCGRKGIDRSGTGTKKFCSGSCAQLYWRRSHGIGTTVKTPSCIYNIGIQCMEPNCNTCGWNTKVEEKRKEALAYG